MSGAARRLRRQQAKALPPLDHSAERFFAGQPISRKEYERRRRLIFMRTGKDYAVKVEDPPR